MKLRETMAIRLSHSTLQLNRLLANNIPIVKRTLDSATRTFLTKVRLLGDDLNFTTLTIVKTRFLPLCLRLLLRLLFLTKYELLYNLTRGQHYRTLFSYVTRTMGYVTTMATLFFRLLAMNIKLLVVAKNK